MNNDVKKYLKIGALLGGIGAIAAGLIGGFDLLTAPVIAKAEAAATQQGLTSLYSDMKASTDGASVSGYQYVTTLWIVYSDEGKQSELGRAYKLVGSDSHGKLTLMVGVSGGATPAVGKIYVVKDEQTKTYATTLIANYIDLINAGSKTIDDIKCGATMSATLTRKMCLEAKEAYTSEVA